MFDTFLQLDTIQGESTDTKHKNWIEIFSFSHGIAQVGAGAISSAGARVAGKVDHHDFTVTKRVDKSSPYLYKNCCLGKHLPKGVVEICRNTGNKEVLFKYTFDHVVVSSINVGGGQGQEVPVETVSFQYGKIKWEYNQIDPTTGANKGSTIAEHNVLENKTA